jgi:Lipocalin-like domain
MMASRVLATMLAFALGAGAAVAQPAKSLREQLVGTWDFVIAEITAADGKKNFPFGERPKGMLIFTADGHFSQVHISGDLPKIASNGSPAPTPTTARSCTARFPSSAPIRSTRRRRR